MGLKVGTTGLLRVAKSVSDYILFYEIGLSKRPKTFAAIAIVWACATVGTMVFGPREWWGPTGIAVLAFIAPLANFARGVYRSDAPSKPHFVADQHIRRRIIGAQPTPSEKRLGFKRIMRNSGFDGPIIVSDSFNIEKMSNRSIDWTLVDGSANGRYSELVSNLKTMRRELVAYGRQSLLRAMLNGKALINEKKVAFDGEFPTDNEAVSVFQTDYFVGLCSSERSLDNVVVRENGVERVVIPAGNRLAFHQDGNSLSLPSVANNTPPISLHFGVEVLAISQDGVFRVPVQSHQTEYSQGMRAPLASGSIDWEDVKGTESLKGLIVNAARRELAEEWGSANSAIGRKLLKVSPEPIGYFRSSIRCGKPQFVAIAKLNCNDHELIADTSEVYRIGEDAAASASAPRSQFKVNSTGDLTKALDNILSKQSKHVDSVALLWRCPLPESDIGCKAGASSRNS